MSNIRRNSNRGPTRKLTEDEWRAELRYALLALRDSALLLRRGIDLGGAVAVGSVTMSRFDSAHPLGDPTRFQGQSGDL